MNALLITYDLNKETKRPPIVEAIKKLGKSRVQLSESSYAIATSKTADTIYQSLERMIDKDDNLYVIPLCQVWMGYGPKDVNEWLDKYLLP